MNLMELARENAKRLNLLNDIMASNRFLLLSRYQKDLMYEETRALSTLLQIQGKVLEEHKTPFTHEKP